MRSWCVLAWGACCLVLVGCQEPPEFVPVTAPGAVIEPPKEPEDKAAQALGEVYRARTAGLEKQDAATKAKPAPKAEPAPPTAKGEMKTTATGLKYETLSPGNGPEVKAGQTVTVNYKGTLQDGTTFDQGAHVEFLIGQKRVIDGWDQGVVGMKVGERRKLIIPPELGYGEEAQPKIPPNSTLTFEIEVLKAE